MFTDGMGTRRNRMENHGNALQIISASRRTDIPNHYAPWFLQRIRERYVYVRNARDFHQIQQVDLSPESVACMVFWTKNPEPLMPHLHQLSSYHYYFQYTINAYYSQTRTNSPLQIGVVGKGDILNKREIQRGNAQLSLFGETIGNNK